MISALVALVLSLLVQVQSPDVPVATKLQAVQLAVEVINLAQAQQALASSTPAVSLDATSTQDVSTPVLSQGVTQGDASTTAQNIQQITQIISPSTPVIVPIPASCSFQAMASPTPHGGPSQPYMAGWDVTLTWPARDTYSSDKNATITIGANTYKASKFDLYGNGSATFHQSATSTTYTAVVNVNNVHIQPQTSCSTTVDLTDLIASTGIPLETIVFAPTN